MKEVNELQYSKDWRNPSDFATYENNEERVRADMQFLFDEIKNWANSGLLPALVELAKQVKFVNPYRVRVGDVDENGDPYFAEMEPGLVTVKSQDGDILYTLRLNALGVEVENGYSWASFGMGLDSDCPEITLMNTAADGPSTVQMMAEEEQASVTVRAGGNELRFYANQYGAQVAGLSEPVMNYDAATKWYVKESIQEALDDLEVPSTGGSIPETDSTLVFEDGRLAVNTTNRVEEDNTLPITSAGVYAAVGNIELLLETI